MGKLFLFVALLPVGLLVALWFGAFERAPATLIVGHETAATSNGRNLEMPRVAPEKRSLDGAVESEPGAATTPTPSLAPRPAIAGLPPRPERDQRCEEEARARLAQAHAKAELQEIGMAAISLVGCHGCEACWNDGLEEFRRHPELAVLMGLAQRFLGTSLEASALERLLVGDASHVSSRLAALIEHDLETRTDHGQGSPIPLQPESSTALRSVFEDLELDSMIRAQAAACWCLNSRQDPAPVVERVLDGRLPLFVANALLTRGDLSHRDAERLVGAIVANPPELRNDEQARMLRREWSSSYWTRPAWDALQERR